MNKFTAWINSRLSSVLILAVVLLVLFPLAFDIFRLNLVVPDLRLRGAGPGHAWGRWRRAGAWARGLLRPGRLRHGHVPQAGALDPASTKIQSTPGIPDFTGTAHRAAPVVATSSTCSRSLPSSPFPRCWRHHRLRHVQAALQVACTSPSSPRRWRDPHGAHHRPAGLHGRR